MLVQNSEIVTTFIDHWFLSNPENDCLLPLAPSSVVVVDRAMIAPGFPAVVVQ